MDTLRLIPSAGVALLAPDIRGNWGTRCRHGHDEAWRTREIAEIARQHPEDWCEDCWIERNWHADYAMIVQREAGHKRSEY